MKENGEIDGHLPREISRFTKYYLDLGATMHCELISTSYRRESLVHGGLEMACCVTKKNNSNHAPSKIIITIFKAYCIYIHKAKR